MRGAAVLAPELRVWKAVGDTVVEAEPEPVPPGLPRPTTLRISKRCWSTKDSRSSARTDSCAASWRDSRSLESCTAPTAPFSAGCRAIRPIAGPCCTPGVFRPTPHDAVARCPHHAGPLYAVNRLARERWLRPVAGPVPGRGVVARARRADSPRPNLLEAAPHRCSAAFGDRRVLAVLRGGRSRADTCHRRPVACMPAEVRRHARA